LKDASRAGRQARFRQPVVVFVVRFVPVVFGAAVITA